MLLGLLLVGLLGAASTPGTVTASWDANTDGAVGYRLFYGLTPGSETEGVVDAGAATSVVVAGLVAGTRVLFHVRAYDAAGQVSAPSAEIAYLVPAVVGDPCAFPLGASSVSIFVTGKLNKTGSGGAGSRAFLTFQAASPNSPIVALAIRANGVDVPDSVTTGTNLRAPGSLWFTIPAGPFSYSVYALNAAGCSREQATGFTTGP
jgi:hypothetical protein